MCPWPSKQDLSTHTPHLEQKFDPQPPNRGMVSLKETVQIPSRNGIEVLGSISSTCMWTLQIHFRGRPSLSLYMHTQSGWKYSRWPPHHQSKQSSHWGGSSLHMVCQRSCMVSDNDPANFHQHIFVETEWASYQWLSSLEGRDTSLPVA